MQHLPKLIEWLWKNDDLVQVVRRLPGDSRAPLRSTWSLKRLNEDGKVVGAKSSSSMDIDLVESEKAALLLGVPLWESSERHCIVKQTPYLESLVGQSDAAMVRKLNGWVYACKEAKEEVAALRECKSGHVVPLLAFAEPLWFVPFTGDFCLAMRGVAMVLPYYEKGDLYRQVIEESSLEEKSKKMRNLAVAGYARDILRALTCVHGQGWIHRDIKPENILVDKDKVLLADFGLACRSSNVSKKQTCQGTISYMAPEAARTHATFEVSVEQLYAKHLLGGKEDLDRLKGNSKGFEVKSDVYSLGIVLVALLSRRAVCVFYDKEAVPYMSSGYMIK